MKAVEFYDDFISFVTKGRTRANRGGQGDLAGIGYVARLDHGPMDGAKKSIPHGLRHHRQVHVEESGFAFVDAFTEIGVRLIGCAEQNGLGLG